MKIYLAGSLGREWTERLYAIGLRRRLTSFVDTAGTASELELAASEGADLFLDSGAFSAWTKGVTIDVERYADFVLAHAAAFTVVANLDVIPGARGQKPTPKDTDKAAAQGWEHYEYLRKRFADAPFRLLHTYHRGEDVKWLKKIVDRENCVALGGIAIRGVTTTAKAAFIDGVMPYVTDDNGWPIRRLHGFGVTTLSLMERFPWDSVDSSSWLVGTRYGHVYIPIGGDGVQITFSRESPKIAEGGEHYRNFTPPEQRAIRAYVEGKGYTIEQLETDHIKRSELNAIFFMDLEHGWVDRPWQRCDVQRCF